MMPPYFESVPHDDSCAYCTGSRAITPLPKSVHAIYCISLQEQPHRTSQAIAHFHHLGLCRHVILYRPMQGKNGERAIWASHRALAQDALANDRRYTLMLEDDVFFRQSWAKLAPRIERAIAALPSDWLGFYLGHVPFQAYFVRPSILRVRSACAHAYIASPRLLAWLAETEPLSATVSTWRRIGRSIDGAMANLPGMYALFPMAVLQRFLGDYRVDSHVDSRGKPRSWRDINRWRYLFIFRGALLAEGLAVMLSPYYRFTLEHYRQKSEPRTTQAAQLVQASGLFDADYYLKSRPDVAAQEVDPLWHYLHYGAAEGAWPSALFDPQYYAAQSPDLGQENPLVHFIRVGSANGRKPHPVLCFGDGLIKRTAKI
jgi:hypothetical protein